MGEKERKDCRVSRSDPDFKRLFKLANDLAIAKNPQRWFNLARGMDVSEAERLAVVAIIESQLEEAIEEVASLPIEFREFISRLDLDELGQG